MNKCIFLICSSCRFLHIWHFFCSNVKLEPWVTFFFLLQKVFDVSLFEKLSIVYKFSQSSKSNRIAGIALKKGLIFTYLFAKLLYFLLLLVFAECHLYFVTAADVVAQLYWFQVRPTWFQSFVKCLKKVKRD